MAVLCDVDPIYLDRYLLCRYLHEKESSGERLELCCGALLPSFGRQCYRDYNKIPAGQRHGIIDGQNVHPVAPGTQIRFHFI